MTSSTQRPTGPRTHDNIRGSPITSQLMPTTDGEHIPMKAPRPRNATGATQTRAAWPAPCKARLEPGSAPMKGCPSCERKLKLLLEHLCQGDHSAARERKRSDSSARRTVTTDAAQRSATSTTSTVANITVFQQIRRATCAKGDWIQGVPQTC